MRSLVYFLLLLGLLTAGYLTMRARDHADRLRKLAPQQVSSDNFNQVVANSEPPRDEHGAIIVSDPADDLAGHAPSSSSANALAIPVGERELHLLELYGMLAPVQVQQEFEALKQRLALECGSAFQAAYDNGDFEVMTNPQASEALLRLGESMPPILSDAHQVDPSDGTAAEWQLVALAPEDHAGLYELRDTVEWLKLRVGDQ